MVSLASHSAAATVDAETFGRAIDPIIINIVSPIVKLLFAVAVIVFIYGVVQMVWHKTDPEARKTGQYAMIGGLTGLLIMASAWGIINLIANTVKQF
jgi:hypothetical protein